MKPTLFYARGTCSLASMLALEMADLPYQAEEVSLHGDRAKLLAHFPEGRVPALVVGDQVVGETVAILWWIASTCPGSGLLPTGPAAAQPLSVMAWMSSRVHILRRQHYRPMNFGVDGADAEALSAAGWPRYIDELAKLDRLIADGRAEAKAVQAYACVFAQWARVDRVPEDRVANILALADRIAGDPRMARAFERHAALKPAGAAALYDANTGMGRLNADPRRLR